MTRRTEPPMTRADMPPTQAEKWVAEAESLRAYFASPVYHAIQRDRHLRGGDWANSPYNV